MVHVEEILQFIWFLYCWVPAPASEFGFRFVTWPSWQVVAPGEEVTLRCITNLPPDTIKWQHNHRFIEEEGAEGIKVPWKGNFGPRVAKYGSKGSSLLLRISNDPTENRRQEGLYQCVASIGSIAVTSLPGRIEVAFLEPFSQSVTSHNLEIEPGNVFRVPCQRPRSLPEATLRFYKNGQLLDLADEEKYHITQSGDLIVLKAVPASAGQYSCGAYNSFLPQTTDYFVKTDVTLKKERTPLNSRSGPPRLVAFDTTVNTVVGDRVSLLCVTLDPVINLRFWRKGGEASPLELPSSGHLGPKREWNDTSVSIVMREVSLSDEGVYRCHGNNSFGETFVDVSVFVQEAPYIIKAPGSRSVSEGSSSVLDCVFGGQPSPAVAWVFNGNLLTSSDSVKIRENRLELQPVERSQAGIYQCFAFNPFGSAQGTAMITVIPKTVTVSPFNPETTDPNFSFPEREIDILLQSEDEEKVQKKRKDKKRKEKRKDKKILKKDKSNIKWKRKNKNPEPRREMMAPSRPNVTKVSDESVMVTWDVESEEGIPILFYKIQYRRVKGPDVDASNRRWKTIDEDIPPHVKSFEVTGLQPDHVYRFRVLAAYVNNDNQPGLSSRQFLLRKDVKLQRPEVAPYILFLLPVNSRAVTVFWNYDAKIKTEGFIISYRKSTSAVGYTKVTVLGSERRNHTVRHLEPGVEYDFKMNSFNMAGISDFSRRKSFIPIGLNTTSGSFAEAEEEESSTVIPVVTSGPHSSVSNWLLYASLGAGIGLLLLIVVASFIVHSCSAKESAEESTKTKFMDTSLRIHRHSVGALQHPSQNGCSHTLPPDTQVPLLTNSACPSLPSSMEGEGGQSAAQSPSGPHFPPSHSFSASSSPRVLSWNYSRNENRNMNVMRETSFTESSQPDQSSRKDSAHAPCTR